MGDTHDQFITACRAAAPSISRASIGAIVGLTQQAVSNGRFDVAKAVDRWNDAGFPTMEYRPARVDLLVDSPKIPSTEALRALVEHHERTVAVLEGCVDLIQSACPSASMWDEEGGLADQADALTYLEQWLGGLDRWGLPVDLTTWTFVEDPPDQTSSDDDWYALHDGGYIVPEDVLSTPEQAARVREAEGLLASFFQALREAGIREEA